MKNTIRENALMIAKHMHETAEEIEWQVERMRDDHIILMDMHRAEANRQSLSLWRELVRFRRVLYGKEDAR